MVQFQGFIRSLEEANATLSDLKASPRGEYAYTIAFYAPEELVNLEKAFASIQEYTMTLKGNKPILYVEHTYLGNKKDEFSTWSDAEYFLRERLPAAKEIVRYSARGNEYELTEASVRVETIEGIGILATVEADEQRFIDELIIPLHIRALPESLATIAWRMKGGNL